MLSIPPLKEKNWGKDGKRCDVSAALSCPSTSPGTERGGRRRKTCLLTDENLKICMFGLLLSQRTLCFSESCFRAGRLTAPSRNTKDDWHTDPDAASQSARRWTWKKKSRTIAKIILSYVYSHIFISCHVNGISGDIMCNNWKKSFRIISSLRLRRNDNNIAP